MNIRSSIGPPFYPTIKFIMVITHPKIDWSQFSAGKRPHINFMIDVMVILKIYKKLAYKFDSRKNADVSKLKISTFISL